MKWAILLSMQAPGVVLKFVAACNEPDKAKREVAIAGAIVAAYAMIEPLLSGKPGQVRVWSIASKYIPLIAAEFGA